MNLIENHDREYRDDNDDNPWIRTPSKSKMKNDLKTNWF